MTVQQAIQTLLDSGVDPQTIQYVLNLDYLPKVTEN